MAAASVIAEDFDEEFLKCPICMDLLKDPKILPCLHTFCRTCLEQVATNSGGRKFRCPKCRSDVELSCPVQSGGVDKLKTNFYINKLLDFRTLRQSRTTSVQCQACQSRAQVSAVCGDCTHKLCNNCVTVHKNTPALQDHVIITLDDLEDPTIRAQYARQVYCPRHKQRMTFYCEPCATLVCRDCAVDKHRAGERHDPKELDEVAPKYKESVAELMAKAKDVASVKKDQVKELEKELTTTDKNCKQVKKEIQQHYKKLRSKLKQEEQQLITKVQKVNEDRKNELGVAKQNMVGEQEKTVEALAFCQNVLDRDNNSEFLSLKQQMEERLQLLASHKTVNKTFEGCRTVSFQPSSVSLVSGGSLSVSGEFNISVEELAVESLPCSVTVTPDRCSTEDFTGGNIAPQIEATSPQGKTTVVQTKLQTGQRESGSRKRIRVSETWVSVWRPQTTGKHTLSICMGDRKDLGFLTVDVGSNNPVLRFGDEGSQQGQFDCPVDVAVRGDRLYVADTDNKRVQVFDLSGNFCSSFLTTTGPTGLAVQTDGTVVVNCGKKVKTFLPSGELLHKFPRGEYCTDNYGLAVQRDGRVVVADPDKHSIFLFEADGTLVRQVGGWGQGEGQFNDPHFVSVDKEDNIIVADKNNDRVQVFDKDLNFKHKFGQEGEQPQDMLCPTGVSADSRGNIVLANLGDETDGVGHGKLQVFRPDGTWVSTISSDGDKLNYPHGVAVTDDGHVFVADASDHCIRKYRYM